MVIESTRTNISALRIISELYRTDDRLESNLERISSGLRIRSAKDDPGGFSLSNKLYTQFRGLSRASENTQELINLTSTAEGATNEIIDLLNDIRDAAVAASGGSAAQQAVINEKLEELNRIADTTRYGDKYLLNGNLTTKVGFKSGTRDFGASLAFGPNATSLLSGRSYLNITATDSGAMQLQDAGDGFNIGLSPADDLAVSTSQLLRGAGVAVGGDPLSSITANYVSLASGNLFTYQGYLANGTTFFSGAYSVTAANTVNDLITSIQSSINAAEGTIGVNGTGTLETTVGLNGNGRLTFTNSSQDITEFDIDITIQNAASATRTDFTITRDATIYNPQSGGTATGAAIGNSITAITGSTFDSGTFTIDVSNVVAAQQRQIETADQFRRNPIQEALPGTLLDGSLINGVFSISTGDTFQIDGTEADGGTFTTIYTVGADTGVGDGLIDDYQSLIDELNNRDKSQTSLGFNQAVATLSTGLIQLYDDVADDSSTNLQITVTSITGPSQGISSNVNQAGSRETATFSIDGGTAVEASAGDVVTLEGVNLSGGPNPEVTFRVGSGFSAGNDELQTTAKEFVGTLNGGAEITFQNGDQAVKFEAGTASIYPIQKYQQVTLDFDAVLDITATQETGGETFVISTTSNAANYQIGGDTGELKQFLFADLNSNNLGTGAGNSLDNINVTTATGATQAIAVIDDALEQVTAFSSRLGAFSSRLDSTVSVLDGGALSMETAYSDIVSADIAKETTELAMNSVLLQAQSAVLSQANGLPQAFVKILLDLGN